MTNQFLSFFNFLVDCLDLLIECFCNLLDQIYNQYKRLDFFQLD